MKFHYLILFLVMLAGCTLSQPPSNQNTDPDSLKETGKYTGTQSIFNDSILPCKQRDTTTKSGIKIHYIQKDNGFQVSWSNDSFSRIQDTVYECFNGVGVGVFDYVPKLCMETAGHLVMQYTLWTSGGGDPLPIAVSALILPKNAKDSIYSKNFLIHNIGNYLVYADELSWDIIYLSNIETGKEQEIRLDPSPPPVRAPGMAIKDIEIRKGRCFIIYEIESPTEKPLYIHKKIRVRI